MNKKKKILDKTQKMSGLHKEKTEIINKSDPQLVLFNWCKKEKIHIFLIFLVSIFYTSTLIFSSDRFIPFGIDFDSNLSPIVNMLKSNFSLWDDSWWLGFPDYAGPLSNIFYPISTFVFVVFGVVFGLKLLIFIHILLSGIGFYLFSQYLTKNNFARLYGSIIYMLCGSLAIKIVAGHLEKLLIFPWIPLTLYFFYKYIDNRQPRYIIFSSISASMFILAGDLYGMLFFSFLFLAFFLVKIVSSKDKELIYSFLKIITLTLLISSIRLVPLFFIKNFLPRSVDVFQGLENILFVFSRFYGTSTETSYGVWESYSFIGILPFILSIIGSIFHKSKEKYYLFLSIIIALFWVQGNVPSLAKAVHSLPFIDIFRVPTRIYIFLTFYLIALSTLGFDIIISKSKKLNSKWAIFIISCIILFIASYNLYSENNKFLQLDFDQSSEKMYGAINNDIKSFGAPNTIAPTLVVVNDPASLTRQHVFMQNGLHYFNAYYGYKFDFQDHINVNGTTYSIPDIKISLNAVKGNGQQIQVQLITQQYNNSLPFAFIIRGNQVIGNLSIESYKPGDVLIDMDNALPGDIVVLKTSYYTGWSVKLGDKGNYINANNYQGLVSYQITEPHENLRMHFLYRPVDLYIALAVMFLSIPFSFLLVYKKIKLF